MIKLERNISEHGFTKLNSRYKFEGIALSWMFTKTFDDMSCKTDCGLISELFCQAVFSNLIAT